MQLAAFDDLHNPAAGVSCGKRHARSLVSGIGEDTHDERPEGACALVENQTGAVAVLNVGGVDGDAQQEAKRVDEDMLLAARNFLGPIVALRIDPGPPFGAAFVLWLSMMAAVGLASRPSCSRTAT